MLWSLTDKSPAVAFSDVQRVGFGNSGSNSGSSSGGPSQSTFSVPPGLSESDAQAEFQNTHGSFWSIASRILRGSTSVFYLVGAICILNMVACQFLYLSSPASSKNAQANGATAQSDLGEEPPRPQEYFMQPGYSSGVGHSAEQGPSERGRSCLLHPAPFLSEV